MGTSGDKSTSPEKHCCQDYKLSSPSPPLLSKHQLQETGKTYSVVASSRPWARVQQLMRIRSKDPDSLISSHLTRENEEKQDELNKGEYIYLLR